MGLVREDGTPKLASACFPKGMGICQWFHYEDPRLETGVEWLRKLKVKYLRTGLSWADSFRPNAQQWFDHQMEALDEFETTLTLCFTPEHLGQRAHYTSPPRCALDFADFVSWAVQRYACRNSEWNVLNRPALEEAACVSRVEASDAGSSD
jgi:beta-xylosidase